MVQWLSELSFYINIVYVGHLQFNHIIVHEFQGSEVDLKSLKAVIVEFTREKLYLFKRFLVHISTKKDN